MAPQFSWIKAVGGVIGMAFIGLYLFGNLSFSAESWKYALSDTWVRLNAPNYDWPPADLESLPQAEVISKYERLGFDLHCYGQLTPEEQIDKRNDYLCWFLPRKAHGNIPVTMVTFFFAEKKLSMVRVQIPPRGHKKLLAYFSRALTALYAPVSKEWSFRNRGLDGESIVGWHVKHGLLLTSSEELRGEDIIYLWIASEFAYSKTPKPEPAKPHGKLLKT
jgi:hypothetical protein